MQNAKPDLESKFGIQQVKFSSSTFPIIFCNCDASERALHPALSFKHVGGRKVIKYFHTDANFNPYLFYVHVNW